MKVIILGTAHLATSPGKCSPDKTLRECYYSREIINRIKPILEQKGFIVMIDYAALQPNPQMKGSTWKQEQSRELRWRADFVNAVCSKYGTSNCLYVSVHVNGIGTDGKWHDARGWCVFTSPGKTKADDLATEIWKVADATFPKGHKYAIRADWSDKDPDFEAALFVLTKTKCPAVLTENFFQDNKEDVAYLLSEEGKAAVVKVHVEGIINYINKTK